MMDALEVSKEQVYTRFDIKTEQNWRINNLLYWFPIILDKQGFFTSCEINRCIDGEGNPQPWFTYAATDYIRNLDLTSRTVFEYGSGGSTLFFAARCAFVTAVENLQSFFETMQGRQPQNAKIKFRPDLDAYINTIHEDDTTYDIIIIDAEDRARCAVEALKRLSPDGMVILDNSDCWVGAAKVLRDADLLQVDMSDFSPFNWYRGTTSFFFRREFRAKPIGEHQPQKAVGMLLPNLNP